MIGKERNFGLDVVRSVSIILVLLAHRFNFTYEIGAVGVQIFFILSGFLIGQILLKDFSNYGSLNTVLKFWKRRWFRTLPLYYLVLCFKILVYGNPYGWKIIVYFFFLQANFVGIGFFGVSWSLVVEEWFYIFLPLATLLFFRKGIDFKKYVYFLFGFIFLFFATRFLWNYTNKGIIIYQFDCLLLGVFLASIKLYLNRVYCRLNSFYLFLIGILGTVFLTFVLGDIDQISIYSTFYRVIWYFLISIFISLIVPYIEQSKSINERLKKNRFLFHFFTWTSVLTYSIYLLHMEIFNMNFSMLNDNLNALLHFMILYAVSFIIYSFFEHPMMMLRDKFSLKQYINSINFFSIEARKN